MYRILIFAQEVAATADPEATKSVLEYIHEGGPLSYLLVSLSVVGVALMIRNAVVLRRGRISPPGVFERLASLVRANQLDEALAFCSAPANDSFLTRIFGSALSRCASSPLGFIGLRTALEESGLREADRLHRSNESLGLIAAVGPMLGLLGTVIGMIGAFATIGNLEGAARSKQLAVFMSYALVCTAEGLIVAIPCTVAFSLFRRHIDHLVHEVAEQIESLTRHIERATGRERPPLQTSNPQSAEMVHGAGA